MHLFHMLVCRLASHNPLEMGGRRGSVVRRWCWEANRSVLGEGCCKSIRNVASRPRDGEPGWLRPERLGACVSEMGVDSH